MLIRPRITALAAAFLISAQSLLAPVAAQNLPNLGGTEREDLSPVMERKLGEQIMRDIRRDRDYLNDAPTLEYLNNFGNSLVAARLHRSPFRADAGGADRVGTGVRAGARDRARVAAAYRTHAGQPEAGHA